MNTQDIFASITRSLGQTAAEHLAPLAEVMVRAVTPTDPTRRFLVSAPPRHGTTTLFTHAMALAIRENPRLRLGYATYSAAKAFAVSHEVAGLVAPYVDILANSESRQGWSTTAGGGLFVCGVGGALNGREADVVVIDSPFKHGLEVRDPKVQERVYDWYRDVVLTRIGPSGSVVVAGERWARGDLHGRILAKRSIFANDGRPAVEHVNIPALSAAGGALWPERFSVGALEQIRQNVGERDFAALYMGAPVEASDAVREAVDAALNRIEEKADLKIAVERAVRAELTDAESRAANWKAEAHKLEGAVIALGEVRKRCEAARHRDTSYSTGRADLASAVLDLVSTSPYKIADERGPSPLWLFGGPEEFEEGVRDLVKRVRARLPKPERGALATSLDPIPMLLWCPECGGRHVDVGPFATKPHHTHACQFCGHVWRPAKVDTVGVQFLPGYKNDVEP